MKESYFNRMTRWNPFVRDDSGKNPNIIELLGRRETLERAVRDGQSIVRYGDGELFLAARRYLSSFRGIGFQKKDRQLSARLRGLLYTPVPNVVVCYNNYFMANDEYRFVLPYERSGKEYSGYETVFSPNDVAILARLRERTFYESQFEKIRVKTKLRTFGEASCFWLSLCYEEYATNAIHDILRLYRRLLQGRRVLFVAPDNPLAGPSFRELCRQGVITSPRRVEFLPIPASDCFDYYGDIRGKVESFQDVDTVFIQAGPTATVLAADLAGREGLVAYDVGSWNSSLAKAFQVHGFSF